MAVRSIKAFRSGNHAGNRLIAHTVQFRHQQLDEVTTRGTQNRAEQDHRRRTCRKWVQGDTQQLAGEHA